MSAVASGDGTAAAQSTNLNLKKNNNKPCVFFNSQKGCRNGDACPFPHTIRSGSSSSSSDDLRGKEESTSVTTVTSTTTSNEPPPPQPWIDAATGQRKPCKFFFRSKRGCRAGAACQFSHVPQTTTAAAGAGTESSSNNAAEAAAAAVTKEEGSVVTTTTAMNETRKQQSQLPNKTTAAATNDDSSSGSTGARNDSKENSSSSSSSNAAVNDENQIPNNTTRNTSNDNNHPKVEEAASSTTPVPAGRSLAKGRVLSPPPQQQRSSSSSTKNAAQPRQPPSSKQRQQNNNSSVRRLHSHSILAKAYELKRIRQTINGGGSSSHKPSADDSENNNNNSNHNDGSMEKSADPAAGGGSVENKKKAKEDSSSQEVSKEEAIAAPESSAPIATTTRSSTATADKNNNNNKPSTTLLVVDTTTPNKKVAAAMQPPEAPRSSSRGILHHLYDKPEDSDNNSDFRKGTKKDSHNDDNDDIASEEEEQHAAALYPVLHPHTKTSSGGSSSESKSIYDTDVTEGGFALEFVDNDDDDEEESAGGWSSSEEEEKDNDGGPVSEMTHNSANNDDEDEAICGSSKDGEKEEQGGADDKIETGALLEDEEEETASAAAKVAEKLLVGSSLLAAAASWMPSGGKEGCTSMVDTSPEPTETSSSLFVQAWTSPYAEEEVELWEQQLESGSKYKSSCTTTDRDNDDDTSETAADSDQGPFTAKAQSVSSSLLLEQAQKTPTVDQSTSAIQECQQRQNVSVVISFDADEAQAAESNKGQQKIVAAAEVKHDLHNRSTTVSPSKTNSDLDWDTVCQMPTSPSEFISPIGKFVATAEDDEVEMNRSDDGSSLGGDWCQAVGGGPASPSSIYSTSRDDQSTIFGIAVRMKNDGNAAFLEENYQDAIALYKKAGILLDEILPTKHQFVHVSDCYFIQKAKAEQAIILGNRAVCHLRLKSWKTASIWATLALEADPSNERARFHLAEAFFEMKNFVDCIDNAVRVSGEKAAALVAEALQALRSMVSSYECFFRLVIDSYRLRENDEYLQLGEKGVSSYSLYGMHPAERDCGKTPVNHFRAYIEMGVVQGIIPSFMMKDDTMMQAILFMAHSDEFSNISYPVTGHEIEVYYDIKCISDETVESLRKFALDIKGPVGEGGRSLSNYMLLLKDEEIPSWQPTAWRYSCSHVLV